MQNAVFIVQGEGRGHMSQALALAEHLDSAGWEVQKVFLGTAPYRKVPGYFTGAFGEKLGYFQSPWLLSAPNRRGIRVWASMALHIWRSPVYLLEVRKLRQKITLLKPDFVFNFYDPVGALALRKLPPGICRVGIGHHFTLHLENYPCPAGSWLHKRLLRTLTGIVMKSCDRVFALSFRDIQGDGRIEVLPPLIRKAFRKTREKAGGRYLVYLLYEGYVSELLRLKKEVPGFRADVFSDLPRETLLGEGIELHVPDEKNFREKMTTCKALICTSGFDTAAEAAYLGVPLLVIPVENHFEQACNAADVERSGLGFSVQRLTAGSVEKVSAVSHENFRSWADSAGRRIIEALQNNKQSL